MSDAKPAEDTLDTDLRDGIKTLPKIAFGCFAVLGFTTGLYIGLSESPVVGGFVGGVLSLVTGGAVTFFTGKDDKRVLPVRHLKALSKCIILFCFLSLLGSFIGIGLREDFLGLFQSAKQSPVELVRLDRSLKDISSDLGIKIGLLQQLLKQQGIDNAENNRIVQVFIDGAALGKDVQTLTNQERLSSIGDYLRKTRMMFHHSDRLRSWHTAVGDELSALNEAQQDSKDYKRRKEYLQNLGSIVADLPYMDSNEADAVLKNYYMVRQPHLDVLLDRLISAPVQRGGTEEERPAKKLSMKRYVDVGVPVPSK